MHLFSRHAVVLRSCGSLYMKPDIESSSDLFRKHKTRADLFALQMVMFLLTLVHVKKFFSAVPTVVLTFLRVVMFFTVHMETV